MELQIDQKGKAFPPKEILPALPHSGKQYLELHLVTAMKGLTYLSKDFQRYYCHSPLIPYMADLMETQDMLSFKRKFSPFSLFHTYSDCIQNLKVDSGQALK